MKHAIREFHKVISHIFRSSFHPTPIFQPQTLLFAKSRNFIEKGVKLNTVISNAQDLK